MAKKTKLICTFLRLEELNSNEFIVIKISWFKTKTENGTTFSSVREKFPEANSYQIFLLKGSPHKEIMIHG